jgi:hypothetical protein
MSTYTIKFDTGAEITLRATATKDGTSTYLAARPASEPRLSRFGINVAIAAVGGKLPKKATVLCDGKPAGEITLVAGVTETSGVPKVSGLNSVQVNVDGSEQNLKIERISQPNAGTANVLIRSARPGGQRVHNTL